MCRGTNKQLSDTINTQSQVNSLRVTQTVVLDGNRTHDMLSNQRRQGNLNHYATLRYLLIVTWRVGKYNNFKDFINLLLKRYLKCITELNYTFLKTVGNDEIKKMPYLLRNLKNGVF